MAFDVAALKAQVEDYLKLAQTVVADAESVAKVVEELPDLPGVTQVKGFVAAAVPYLNDGSTILKEVLDFLNQS